MKRWPVFLPVAFFFALCLLLYTSLFQEKKDDLPSPLINQPLPTFALPAVLNKDRIVTEADWVGQVALVNVWATWCIACRVEHPFLNELAQQGVIIYGINYKDKPNDAKKWLTQLHNPYRVSVADQEGRLGIELGVYGAPETYLIDDNGVIHYKHTGVIDEKIWLTILQPRYMALIQQQKERS